MHSFIQSDFVHFMNPPLQNQEEKNVSIITHVYTKQTELELHSMLPNLRTLNSLFRIAICIASLRISGTHSCCVTCVIRTHGGGTSCFLVGGFRMECGYVRSAEDTCVYARQRIYACCKKKPKKKKVRDRFYEL